MRDENDDVTGLFGNTTYSKKSGKNMKSPRSWHKLRKHVVRDFQWCESIKPLIDNLKKANRPLRYLGLPGTDLLDLRLIHQEICLPNEVELFFLGFNTEAKPGSKYQVEADISLDEVRRLGFVDSSSIIRPDAFQSMSEDKHMAFHLGMTHAPYDVVNLDLCDGLAKEDPGEFGTTMYNAVSKVIRLQEKTRDPWVLFITTRVGEEYNSKNAFNELLSGYRNNLSDCLAFRDAVEKCFGGNYIDTTSINLADPLVHFNIFTTGISKWLISLGLNSDPTWEVEVLDSLSYKVKPENPYQDLVSLAYKFTPRIKTPTDKFKLSNIDQIEPLTECELAARVVRKILETVSCDDILRDDPEVYSNILDSCCFLMSQARYDPQEFREWASQEVKDKKKRK